MKNALEQFGCWVSGLALVMCLKQHRQHFHLRNFHCVIKSHIDRDRSFRFFYWVGKLHTTGTNHETVPPPIRDMLYFFYLKLRACGKHNIQIQFCSQFPSPFFSVNKQFKRRRSETNKILKSQLRIISKSQFRGHLSPFQGRFSISGMLVISKGGR